MFKKDITRRDFLNGILWMGVTVATTGWSFNAIAETLNTQNIPTEYYPPALTGLRGSHAGSFENAHTLAWAGKSDWGNATHDTTPYDLIIVGAGISGLSAAHFYQQSIKKDARILILDNHDDFGGHAKRNEFIIDGKIYLSYGGSQSMATPSKYSKVAKKLLVDIGIDLNLFKTAYDKQFFTRHDLTQGIFFDSDTYQHNTLIRSCLPSHWTGEYYAHSYLPGLKVAPSFTSILDKTPLSDVQRAKVREVMQGSTKAKSYFAGKSGKRKLYQNNYVEFLHDVYKLTDPALIALLSMPLADDYACGGTSVLLWDAIDGGLYGLPPASYFKNEFEQDHYPDEYIYHFPDGNASIARLLVKKLIPDVASVETAVKAVTSHYDYSQLDRDTNAVNIRLSSLVIHADNDEKGTVVRYVKDGKVFEAHAQHTIMAGWHMMAAHIIPSLPAKQKAAMQANIKMPLVYAQIALRQWLPLKRSGIGSVFCPSGYFQYVLTDFPVNMGDYQPRREPDAPIILQMIRMPNPLLGEGKPADLFRAGRAELLGTSFETFETNIRKQLTDMYGSLGFDVDRDIAAITVNRWPHGYVYAHNEINGKPAYQAASKVHGHISIANVDSAGETYLNFGIDAAWRAVQELKKIDL
jgi:spermidine dehydrogenase